MKRQKPMFSKDWADEFTPWIKWWYRKMERIRGKRKLQKDMKEQFYPETWIKEYKKCNIRRMKSENRRRNKTKI